MFCGPGLETPYSSHIRRQRALNSLEGILILLERAIAYNDDCIVAGKLSLFRILSKIEMYLKTKYQNTFNVKISNFLY